jgi:hypothetical protein
MFILQYFKKVKGKPRRKHWGQAIQQLRVKSQEQIATGERIGETVFRGIGEKATSWDVRFTM